MITMKVYFEAIRGSDVVFTTCESDVPRGLNSRERISYMLHIIHESSRYDKVRILSMQQIAQRKRREPFDIKEPFVLTRANRTKKQFFA